MTILRTSWVFWVPTTPSASQRSDQCFRPDPGPQAKTTRPGSCMAGRTRGISLVPLSSTTLCQLDYASLSVGLPIACSKVRSYCTTLRDSKQWKTGVPGGKPLQRILGYLAYTIPTALAFPYSPLSD